jgi:hypothetical protein
MRRTRTAVLIALPLTALAIGCTVFAGPYWLGVARQALAEQRWPDQRARIEAVVAAVDLPDRFAPVPCDGLGLGADGADRCWRVEALPADVADDLTAALEAAGADRVAASTSSRSRYGVVAADALGFVADRVVLVAAVRELDRDRLPESPFADTSVVHLTADLAAP